MSRQRKIHPEVVKYEKFNKEFQKTVDKVVLSFVTRGTRPRKIIRLIGLPVQSISLWNLKQKVRGHNNFIKDEF